MDLELHKLLREFNIRMDSSGESQRTRPQPDDSDDEDFSFDFDTGRTGSDMDFSGDDDFGNDFSGDDGLESEFGDDFEGDEELPPGLDDMEDDDGTFAGERRVDITDRLKKMLSRTGASADDFGGVDDMGKEPEFDLSSLDDYGDDPDFRRFRGHSREKPMRSFDGDEDHRSMEMDRDRPERREQNDRSRSIGMDRDRPGRFDRPRRPSLGRR